ncbi:DUF2407 ubiquitin-like domain-containing protein [Mucidula mucida]|nr:DUF2407 ubiquitin-like domain-containing protein [Mucidula mucida]
MTIGTNMLSEKAKGKRRAIDLLVPAGAPEASTSHEVTVRHLVIRFTEGLPDLQLTIGKQDTVKDVKTIIRNARADLEDRKLRLIYSGRLLTDGIPLFSWLDTHEGRQKKVASSVDDEAQEARIAAATTTWLHCSVGAKVEFGQGDNDEGLQATQMQPARGFDRLASVGFSEADIANFRRQFHSQSSNNFLDEQHFETEEEYDEHARALEEQWIDSMDNAGTASLSQSTSANSSIIQGLVIGFFFPILPFFFIRKPIPPVFWEDGTEYEPPDSVIFSRAMQVGLVIGFIANIMFGLWRFFLDAS